MRIRKEFLLIALINIMPNMQCHSIKASVWTFSSRSTSSLLAFFSYPGGGNGKQRDIEQNPKTQNSDAFHQRKWLNYFPKALFWKGNGPVTMLLSIHHVPTFITRFNTSSWSCISHPTATSSKSTKIPFNNKAQTNPLDQIF